MPSEMDIIETGLLGFIEVIDGEIITPSPNSYKQNIVAKNLYQAVRPAAAFGLLMQGHMSYVLMRHADDVYTMRLPDVSYTRHTPDFGITRLLPAAPNFAVKIVADYEIADQHERLISDYLAAGTQMVWLVYPDQEEIHTYHIDGRIARYAKADSIEVEHIFPVRVEIALDDIFNYPWD